MTTLSMLSAIAVKGATSRSINVAMARCMGTVSDSRPRIRVHGTPGAGSGARPAGEPRAISTSLPPLRSSVAERVGSP
jgi:hypothetical protein